MNKNGTNDQQITNEHLQELFRRFPASADVMRMILLEAENTALKARLAALETPDVTTTNSVDEVEMSYSQG